MEKSKQMLMKYFPEGESVLDDSFFKYYMRDFVPVTQDEVAKISSQICQVVERMDRRRASAIRG